MTINEIQDEIIEEFEGFDDWMDKYQLLIDLGVNPAGCDWDVQQISVKGSDPIKWYNVDFGDPNQIDNLRGKCIDKIRTALAIVVFGKLYYGIESAGIGYVTSLLHR